MPDPDPKLVVPDYVCVLCETELWLTDEQRRVRRLVRTKKNEFFFLPDNSKEVMPSGPPRKVAGGSRSKNRNKKKGTQKHVEPWKLE